ncbi:septum formation initiator family protein [Bacillus carboniphilus]|uniref:Septum formation initiator family protein n=1 Tax=Bacillus carboniphilus TaxID=86663 RepID=A0ABY9JRA5_9BACI|nr:septum formation initiator family protein [Bacillus carboniphilus]WLR41935.1 septum formation initiator family protein [Bacillus carboniphilus]
MSAARDEKIKQLQSQYASEREKSQKLNKKKKKGLIRRLTLLSLVAIITFTVISTTLIRQSISIDKQEEKKRELNDKLEQLVTEEEKLNQQIENLNDDEYIEKLAKDVFKVSRDGEILLNSNKQGE